MNKTPDPNMNTHTNINSINNSSTIINANGLTDLSTNLINAWALNQHLPPETLPLLAGELYFNEKTFEDAAGVDLGNAQEMVVIQSPYAALGAVKRMEKTLTSLSERKVRVCAFLRAPESDERYFRNDPSTDHSAEAVKLLRSLGVHVFFRKGIHEKILIIDGIVVYFGSLNILSFNKRNSTEGMIRSENPVKAHWLTLLFALNACPQCMAERRLLASPPSLLLNADSVGAMIAQIRKEKDLSQVEIAELIGTKRGNLSQIECGKHLPSLSTIFEIGKHVDQELLWIPTRLVPFVEEYVRMFPSR